MISKVLINRITNILFFIIITLLAYFKYNKQEFYLAIIITLGGIVLLIRYIYLSSKINYAYILALLLSWLGGAIFAYNRTISLIIYLIVFLIYIKITFDLTRKISSVKFIKPTIYYVVFFVISTLVIHGLIDNLFFLELMLGLLLVTLGLFSFMYMTQSSGNAGFLFFLGVFILIVATFLQPVIDNFENKEVEILPFVVFAIGQYLICNSMIKKSIEFKFDINFLYSELLLLVSLLSIVLISLKDFSYGIYTVPIVFMTHLILYFVVSKKRNVFILVHLLFVFFVSLRLVFIGYKTSIIGIVLAIISQLILLFIIYNFKNIKWKKSLPLFLIILTGYTFFYFKTDALSTNKYMYFMFSIVNSLLIATAFTNYLQKMSLSNALLSLGISLAFLMNIVVLSSLSSLKINIFVVLITYLYRFLVFKSFIIREENDSLKSQ